MSTKAVAHYPNLWHRNGVYYLRKRVPADLAAALGKTHVVRSLKTRDKRTAEGRYGMEPGAAEWQFEHLRERHTQIDGVGRSLAAGDFDDLPSRDLEGLVHAWFSGLVQPVARPEPGEMDWREVKAEHEQTLAALTSPDPDDMPTLSNVPPTRFCCARARVRK